MQKYLVIAYVALSIVACKKRDEFEAKPRPVVKSIRIAEINDPDLEYWGLDELKYRYDQKNRVVKVKLKAGVENTYSFKNDLLFEMEEFRPSRPTQVLQKVKSTLLRDTKNRIIQQAGIWESGQRFENLFAYDENDNLIHSVFRVLDANSFAVRTDTTYYFQHD